MNFLFKLFLFTFYVVYSKAEEEVSECLKKSIKPLAKLERSFSYVFNNFEKVCDILEDGAFYARKCSPEDQRKFYQYTTFYRIHCIDYEEDLQDHLPCIAKAAAEADSACKEKCNKAHKIDKNADKDTKHKKGCRSLECSTICYFDELVEECPKAKDVLLKINIGQIFSMNSMLHASAHDNMAQECRNIHNVDYMKSKLLSSSTSLLVDHAPEE